MRPHWFVQVVRIDRSGCAQLRMRFNYLLCIHHILHAQAHICCLQGFLLFDRAGRFLRASMCIFVDDVTYFESFMCTCLPHVFLQCFEPPVAKNTQISQGHCGTAVMEPSPRPVRLKTLLRDLQRTFQETTTHRAHDAWFVRCKPLSMHRTRRY